MSYPSDMMTSLDYSMPLDPSVCAAAMSLGTLELSPFALFSKRL
jgi:hypothetical protein